MRIAEQKNLNFYGTKINALIYNDLHGQTKNINSFINLQDEFYKQNPDEVNLTLSGGDVFVDENSSNDIVAQKLCKKTDAIALGNHDIEGGKYLSRLIEKFDLKEKFLSSNITYNSPTKLDEQILRSKIIDKNGVKIGVIGTSPFDFKKLAFVNEKIDFIEIEQLDKTIENVEAEVLKLKQEHPDIIFLLAHTGEFSPDEKDNYYDKFAQIDGINVIIGGHDHRQVDRWIKNSSGNFVKIISTGHSPEHYFEENLDIAARLNLEIEDGVLEKEKCTSKFIEIGGNSDEDNSNVLFNLSRPLYHSKAIFGHSEIGNIIADSNLWYANHHTKGEPADFAFVNAGTVRANFDKKQVSEQDIINVVPFANELIKTTLTKKQIIDTLNWCAYSTSLRKVSPGMMQVSGMEYTVKPDLTVCDVHILNEDGSIKYNLDDFDDDDTFSAVYDAFLLTGPAGLTELKKDWENNPEIAQGVEFFYASRQKALKEYLLNADKLKDFETVRIKT